MRVADAFRRSRSRLPAEAGSLLALLRERPEQGLAALPGATQAIADCAAPADTRLAALEPLRPAVIEYIEPLVRRLRTQPVPLQRDDLVAFHRLSRALCALRDAFKRVHVDLCDEPIDESPRVPPPRAMLAVARALDLQSRLLVAASRSRIATEREQWDELCRLAFPLWRLSAIDEAFPEAPSTGRAASRRRGDTPRAAFALPLLMRLLEPLGLSAGELDLAHALARGAARRCGLRIDVDGQPHVNPDGPALMLSAHHTVQVDTRSTVAALQRCAARLTAGDSPAVIGLRTTLAPAALGTVLARLREVWGPLHVPTPLVRPPVAQAYLHVGLPRRVPGWRAPAAGRGSGARAAGPTTPASTSVYVYGRATPRTAAASPAAGASHPPIDAAGSANHARLDPARELLTGAGETVIWRGQDARRAVFGRVAEGPRLRLGQLVAVLPRHAGEHAERVHAGRPGSGPTRVLLGRVVTLAQTGGADSRQPFAHDVGVAFWPGAPRAVRFQLEGSTAFDDAWWLPGSAQGDGGSLVLPRDVFERPVDVLLRDQDGDREWRIRRLIDRGPDFDRVALGPIG